LIDQQRVHEVRIGELDALEAHAAAHSRALDGER
jgi:hypothetical protein